MRWIQDLPPYDRTHIQQLLDDTGLSSLEQRRRDARLTMLYKIVHGFVAITLDELGLERPDRRTRAAHRYKFKEKQARSNLRKFSYVNRTVPEWNRLPADIAEVESLDVFKARLG